MPSAACGPTRGSACLAAGRAVLQQISNYSVEGGGGGGGGRERPGGLLRRLGHLRILRI